MDEFHDKAKRGEGFVLKKTDKIIYGYNEICDESRGIGADDKNGIWVALNMLLRLDVVKIAFFVEEEIGCHGSESANMEFFKNCRYILECDRKDGSDFVVNASGVQLCDGKFEEDCLALDKSYYPVRGGKTDVRALKLRGLEMPMANISCGFHNAHSDGEFTYISELIHCLEFVSSICNTL